MNGKELLEINENSCKRRKLNCPVESIEPDDESFYDSEYIKENNRDVNFVDNYGFVCPIKNCSKDTKRKPIKGTRQSYLFQNIVSHFKKFHEQQISLYPLLQTTENIRKSLRILNDKLYIAYNIKICDKKAELEAICSNNILDENGEEKACTYKSYGKVRFQCEVNYLLKAHHTNLKCHKPLNEPLKKVNYAEWPENLNILDLDLTQDLVDP